MLAVTLVLLSVLLTATALPVSEENEGLERSRREAQFGFGGGAASAAAAGGGFGGFGGFGGGGAAAASAAGGGFLG